MERRKALSVKREGFSALHGSILPDVNRLPEQGNRVIHSGLQEHIRPAHGHEIPLQQLFGDLHRIEGGTLTDIIGHNPEVETIGNAVVLTDTAHEHGIISGRVHGKMFWEGLSSTRTPGAVASIARASLPLSFFSVSMLTDSE